MRKFIVLIATIAGGVPATAIGGLQEPASHSPALDLSSGPHGPHGPAARPIRGRSCPRAGTQVSWYAYASAPYRADLQRQLVHVRLRPHDAPRHVPAGFPVERAKVDRVETVPPGQQDRAVAGLCSCNRTPRCCGTGKVCPRNAARWLA